MQFLSPILFVKIVPEIFVKCLGQFLTSIFVPDFAPGGKSNFLNFYVVNSLKKYPRILLFGQNFLFWHNLVIFLKNWQAKKYPHRTQKWYKMLSLTSLVPGHLFSNFLIECFKFLKKQKLVPAKNKKVTRTDFLLHSIGSSSNKFGREKKNRKEGQNINIGLLTQ